MNFYYINIVKQKEEANPTKKKKKFNKKNIQYFETHTVK